VKTSIRFVFLGTLLIATGIVMWIVGRHATSQQAPSLRPVLDRATEAKATLDHVGQELAKMSTEDEIALGQSLIAMEMEKNRFPETSPGVRNQDQVYLNAIQGQLVANGGLRRPDISYRVQILEHPAINAFAMPGGFLFVTTGMLDFVKTEAELAAVLAHEMAHVELRHCIERYQYALKARRVGGEGLEAMAHLGTRLMLQGYQDEQEAEADRWGMQIASRAHYHPQGGQWLFTRLQVRYEGAQPAPRKVSDELSFGLMDGLEDLVATHPNLALRISNLGRAMSETDCMPDKVPYYVGQRNCIERLAMPQASYPEEWKQAVMQAP